MTDRITQLERLTRLRAEGALSGEEFEREKSRLLETRPKPIWLFAIAALAVAIGAVLVIVLARREPAPQAAAGAQPKAAAPVATSTPSPPGPAGPQPLDISSRLRIANGDCSFASDLQRAFANMLHREGNRLRPRTVRFGDMTVTPSLISRSEGVYNAAVNFPRPLLWNGLRLTGLRAEEGWEWGSSTLVFADTPTRVRAALTRMGIRMPASGNLDLPTEGCGSSVAVERRGSGAALTCGGGC